MDYARSPDLSHILPDGTSHEWSLQYVPQQNGNAGHVLAKLGDHGGTIAIKKFPRPSSKFDRFGIVTTWIDSNSQHVYFDDLTYTFRQ